MKHIRKPAVAGLFYPSHPDNLRHKIISFLQEAHPIEKKPNIKAIIVPHAGYDYSGLTAAYAFNHLDGENISKVIIISPSHYEFYDGVSIYDGDGFATPLGELNINSEITDELVKNSKNIFRSKSGHNQEHGIEVELPFLQEILTDFSIVPIVFGEQSKNNIDELSEKLSSIIDNETIIVASSDLSHFYSSKIANELDSLVEKRINNFETNELENDFNIKNCEACGYGAILSLMRVCEKNNINNSLVLHRTDSGLITGDKKSVVGYLSAIFSRN